MNFQQFTKRMKEGVCGSVIKEEDECHGHNIILTEDGKVFVDFKETQLTSIEEAKQFIEQIKFEEEIAQELYEEIPAVKIANLIKEHHNIKVTNKLIETYIELASSKTFSVDPVVTGIRSLNSIGSIIENKIDYTLDDGSVVVISEESQLKLNTLLEDKYQLVEYMRESKDNFMHVLRELS